MARRIARAAEVALISGLLLLSAALAVYGWLS